MSSLLKLYTFDNENYVFLGPFTKEFLLKNYPAIKEELKLIKPLDDWDENYLGYFWPVVALIFEDDDWNFYIGVAMGIDYTLYKSDKEYIFKYFLNALKKHKVPVDVDKSLNEWKKMKEKEYEKDIQDIHASASFSSDSNNINEILSCLRKLAKQYSPLKQSIIRSIITFDDEFTKKSDFFVYSEAYFRPNIEFFSKLAEFVEKYGEMYDFSFPELEIKNLSSPTIKSTCIMLNYAINSFIEQMKQTEITDKLQMLLIGIENGNYLTLEIEENARKVLENVKYIDDLEAFFKILEHKSCEFIVEDIKTLNKISHILLEKISPFPVDNRIILASKLVTTIDQHIKHREPYVNKENTTKIKNFIIEKVIESLKKEKPINILNFLLNLNKYNFYDISCRIMEKATQILLDNTPILEKLSPPDCLNLIKNIIYYSEYHPRDLVENLKKISNNIHHKLEKLKIDEITKDISPELLLCHPFYEILPQKILNEAKNIILSKAEKKFATILEKENLNELIETLKEQPEGIKDEIAENIVWLLLREKINEKAKENINNAIEIIETILEKLEYSLYFKKFKRKLRAKKILLNKKL